MSIDRRSLADLVRSILLYTIICSSSAFSNFPRRQLTQTFSSPTHPTRPFVLRKYGAHCNVESDTGDCDWGTTFDNTSFQPINVMVETTNQSILLHSSPKVSTKLIGPAIITALIMNLPDNALAASNALISTGSFNPDSFRPVCPASDTFYRFLQITTQSVVGDDNFVEYGPLIAEGLLRIRLELCVVESYFNEAVGPFIQREGLSWVLPLHETVETFLAGTIFSLATTFILVGSTKIVSVLMTYADFFIGGPCRLFGGFAYDRSRGRPVTLDVGFGPFKTRLIGPGSPKEEEMLKRKKFIEGSNLLEDMKEELDWSKVEPNAIPVVVISGGVKLFGETFKVAADVLKGLDFFIGRYLTLVATGYIGIKFLHFKVFPDFPPF